ncbi:type VI secretion system tube protein Hcp [Roseateles amylovorans]|uniref:Type VI secretion system tube protein Hcp n=1 Tax=Roseateles amylovorans TaxID=2978473 RepID=A0ABY6ASF1_9BURK|nr:type VI secretion system tube protein Hcp [Roseateles amylovorans]UXH76154.1 type VI secretion system tube protein Hcp [Roseateles amylovorans]
MSLPVAFLDFACLGRPALGESRVQGFEDQIALQALAWSASAVHLASNAGRERTELRPGHVTVSKYLDRSSMLLYRCATESKRYDRARITVIDPALSSRDKPPVPMLTLELLGGTLVRVATRTEDTAHAKPILEELTLSFKDLRLRYYPLDASTLRRPTPTTAALHSSRYD